MLHFNYLVNYFLLRVNSLSRESEESYLLNSIFVQQVIFFIDVLVKMPLLHSSILKWRTINNDKRGVELKFRSSKVEENGENTTQNNFIFS
jgi:hypothetical protein